MLTADKSPLGILREKEPVGATDRSPLLNAEACFLAYADDLPDDASRMVEYL